MAKKKKEDPPAPGSPAWMATFSDLMNLLLCFFVLLFSMSSVDQAKWDAMAQSLASTFSIFQAGSLSFGDGTLLSNGASQLNNLDEYYNNMGESSNETDGESVFDETGKAIGCTHNHTDAEDKRAVFLPFYQLFTGYS